MPESDWQEAADIRTEIHRQRCAMGAYENMSMKDKEEYDDMVFMSMDAYEELFRKLELYKEIAISEKQFESGNCEDARLVLSEIKAKYDL